MSHQASERNVGTQEPEEEKAAEIPPHIRSCKNCFHVDTCKAFAKVSDVAQIFGMLKWVSLPFTPDVIAGNCDLFLNKKDVVKVDTKTQE